MSKDDYNQSVKDDGPRVTPVLDWVYGYRGKDSRANLDRLPTGEVSRVVTPLVTWDKGETVMSLEVREDIENFSMRRGS